jgi:DNA-binding IclR family transcriptional regulator
MKKAKSTLENRRGIQSVDVSGRIIEALCNFHNPVPMKNISALVDASPSQVHRYLTSLVRIGFAKQEEETGYYGLGPLAMKAGLAAIAHNPAIERAQTLSKRIAMELKLTSNTAVMGERGPVVIQIVHGGPPVLSAVALGMTVPLTRSSLGKIFLTYSLHGSIEKILSTELRASGEPKSVAKKIIEKTRKDGLATAEGTFVSELYAISGPIFGFDGSLSSAISLISSNRDLLDQDSEAFRYFSEAIAESNAPFVTSIS